MNAPDALSRCVPGADLTAYAHGELPDWRRAEISRHLLRCAACRADAEADKALLSRLRSFGAAGEDWRAEVAAAGAEVAAGRRARWRAAVVGALAAASVLVTLSLLRPGGSGSPENDGASALATDQLTFPDIGFTALPTDEATLLAAQSMDGYWEAGGGWRDEAATGLAVAALAARRGKALGDDTVAQAVIAGADWLLERLRKDGRLGGEGPEGAAAHAVATLALLEVYSANGDRALRPDLDVLVRALESAGRPDLAGQSAILWARRALGRAKDLGWTGLDDALDRMNGWLLSAPRASTACATLDADLGDTMVVACKMYESAPRG